MRQSEKELQEFKDRFYCRILLEVMNVTDRPYFKPLTMNESHRFLRNHYKMEADINFSLKTGKLVLNLILDPNATDN